MVCSPGLTTAMPTILQNLRDTTLTRAIEANLVNFFKLQGQFPRAKVYTDETLTWFLTRIPSPMCNGVLRTHLTADNLNKKIRTILEPFKSDRVPMMWVTGSSTQPTDLGNHLEAHGLTHVEDWTGMALDVTKLNRLFRRPFGLTIEPINDLETLKQWMQAVAISFGLSDAVAEKCVEGFASFGIGEGSPLRYYAGFLDGKLVSTSMLVLDENFASINCVSTIPEARNRGIAKAVTMAAVEDAISRAYDTVVLQATPSGKNVYRQLGFQEYCKFGIYMWLPEGFSLDDQVSTSFIQR